MIIIISPAKTLDFAAKPATEKYSLPLFSDMSKKLVKELRMYSPPKLEKLMKISSKLANLNYERYQEWHLPFSPQNSKQALFAFRGEVYTGIDADTMTMDDINFAQHHLRILSGLYGILRPLDLIQAYRLEMGTPLKTDKNKDLYQFWGDKLTNMLTNELDNEPGKILINLASNEYYKALDSKKLNTRIITPVFKDFKNGSYKFLSVYGKKARGLMTRFIISNKIDNPENLKLFDDDGYFFNDRLSNRDDWVFTRG
jgi:cytoplasmic iron level regulating protein YaaA (DUF328/UPF0246 family)